MNKFYITLLFAFFLVVIDSIGQEAVAPAIKWYSFEDGVAAVQKTKKKMFVDVYTDWCGWCKKIDASTFQDPDVVKYMNDHFVAVKLDAEQDKEILFNGYTYKLLPSTRKGTHELALSLLKGNASYPSFVFMDQDLKRIRISPGFKQAPQFLNELKFAKEEAYRKLPYEAYASAGGQ